MRQYAKITTEGTKDHLFEECRAREAARSVLTDLFERRGYAPVATPHLEFHDVFRRSCADRLAGQVYSVTDSRGRMLVMRPDSTLPIARVAATRLAHAALPLRLYYHQTVFRRSRFYTGHSDETLQSGVELLGAEGLRADLEIFQCAVEALKACGQPRFRIELGHAEIFRCLADSLGVDEDTREALTDAIESKNLPALKALLAPYGDSAAAQACAALPRLFGGGDVLQQAKPLFKTASARKALAYLAQLYAQLEALGLHEFVDIDLGLVHGQQYYTGLVFRGYIEGSGRTVLSGGRYDGLLGEFGRPAAAVGFALELDPLAEAILVGGGLAPAPLPEVLVFGADGYEAAALLKASSLREEGVVCTCASCPNIIAATNFAKEHAIPRLFIIDIDGEHELVL